MAGSDRAIHRAREGRYRNRDVRRQRPDRHAPGPHDPALPRPGVARRVHRANRQASRPPRRRRAARPMARQPDRAQRALHRGHELHQRTLCRCDHQARLPIRAAMDRRRRRRRKLHRLWQGPHRRDAAAARRRRHPFHRRRLRADRRKARRPAGRPAHKSGYSARRRGGRLARPSRRGSNDRGETWPRHGRAPAWRCISA